MQNRLDKCTPILLSLALSVSLGTGINNSFPYFMKGKLRVQRLKGMFRVIWQEGGLWFPANQ